ncbi:hypothetical protein DEA8626_00923 [Defluviimonas aquaemixtae]|uniref:Thioredoxin domain-containing protein n=1 Tax=Albidovulum aquaemixtae TaxID=1542388 RepID=A0A2R8B491_9RHOB|nr:DUF899 domain-containing protein [Defluviimonas aquaemixtae]SPH17405.1 hypothetical protein DEA8626_00923 [Defluviimonas aquaemixtae]
MTSITDRDTWLAARLELLDAEKAHMRAGDDLAARRRALPKVRIEKDYRFTGAGGEVSLADLFGPHTQLVVYHFMYGTDWEEGCPSCSFWADNFDGVDVHLAARDTAFACISKAPYDKLDAYRKRMDWRFRWVSASGGDFNEDFNVSFTPEELETKSNVYNFRKGNFNGPEAPGLSVFERLEDGTILHTYSTFGRGLEAINGAYHMLDLTPKGRDEEGLDYTQAWLRRHDQYA